jgi:hypothetical protein
MAATRKKKPRHIRFLAAIESGDIKLVERLIAQGTNVNGEYWNQPPASCAIRQNQIQILSLLLRHRLDPRRCDDALFFDAVYYNRPEALKLLATTVFSPDLWRGKTRLEIEKEADLIYQNIQNHIQMNIPEATQDASRLARMELFDAAMTCWEHVRPDPPNITISNISPKGTSS